MKMTPFPPRSVKSALAVCTITVACACAIPASAQDASKQEKALAGALRKIDSQQQLTSGDLAALKAAARRETLTSLRVCGDPGNMPLSNVRREGFENKIIDILAEDMNTQVTYYWRPYIARGLTRESFQENECDVLLDMPIGYEGVLSSEPIYKTTFVFASRSDRHYDIKSLDDPRLKQLKIGVYQTSAIRQVLQQHGIFDNVVIHALSHDADLKPEDQPAYQVQQVVDGTLDIAGVWGPFAGYYKTVKKAPIDIQPVNMMEDDFPLEFELGIGVRMSDRLLKYKIDLALEDKKAEIEKVLRDYGVPLVKCSDCLVEGDLPAHGVYTKPPPVDQSQAKPVVSMQKLESWLAAGADVNEEFDNAVLASDMQRIEFLLGKGADINKPDGQGSPPLVTAAGSRDPNVVKFLLDHHANVDARDGNGMSALHQAIVQDDKPTLKVLIDHGASVEARTPDGLTPLAFAILEDKLAAAIALINAGAKVDAPSGETGLTPLMITAGKQPISLSLQAGPQPIEKLTLNPNYPDLLQVAHSLIDHHADVNVVSASGVTALMLAAAHNNASIVGLLLQSGADATKRSPENKTALDIAVENGNDTVVSLIRLMQQSNNK